MAIVIKIANKTLNPERLDEELRALSFAAALGRQDRYGFMDGPAHTIVPIPAPIVVGETGGKTNVDPGEIRFHTTRDLTPAEDAQLAGALTAHNAATLTAEQGREDQDEADLDTLINAAQAFTTFLTAFDAAGNVTQLKAALRPFCVNVGRAIRIIVRKHRSAAV